ncbi:hypothetical protein AVEN_255998-1 [Araneus ventricosus]|uniref:Uncharacterized protein n=1 Tax=Araneus ventricosus TaxID=182803 RepID=A0A4Y2KX93_ARAVE|nr:hypothetical protein AVEN_255998-1 [Araneus ventricosus]
MGAQIVPSTGRGEYCFRIHGQIYHRTSHLHPAEAGECVGFSESLQLSYEEDDEKTGTESPNFRLTLSGAHEGNLIFDVRLRVRQTHGHDGSSVELVFRS